MKPTGSIGTSLRACRMIKWYQRHGLTGTSSLQVHRMYCLETQFFLPAVEDRPSLRKKLFILIANIVYHLYVCSGIGCLACSQICFTILSDDKRQSEAAHRPLGGPTDPPIKIHPTYRN
ncbi:hypothetical protein KC349_g320 [Hortaea werneckii]|nr:hypothetical protein KC349_g320 [Hortaea werneckii]